MVFAPFPHVANHVLAIVPSQVAQLENKKLKMWLKMHNIYQIVNKLSIWIQLFIQLYIIKILLALKQVMDSFKFITTSFLSQPESRLP